MDIAVQSGFNSKSIFNALFKKFTGRTPSSFKKGVKNRIRTRNPSEIPQF
ncbi:MAG: AraC family transcriptional regulator [Bacteroidota bacterium]